MLKISRGIKKKGVKSLLYDALVGLYFIANITLLFLTGLISPNTTFASTDFSATDLLGQIDSGNNPIWTHGGPYNNTGATGTIDAKGMYRPQGTVIDTIHHRLFVSTCGSRVLVFNLDTNNNLIDRVADYELGQPDINTDFDPVSGPLSITQNNLRCAASAAVDESGNRLFVADSYRDRLLVYNLSGGISNGMDASNVLGSPNFTTGQYATTQSRMAGPYGGMAYDPTKHYLYVADSGNSRILVYDLSSGINDGMNALHVIGQSDFTSSNLNVTQNGMSNPYGLALDISGHRLFVADDSYCSSGRVLIYDTSNISDGMNANNILGAHDFTTEDNSACNNVTAANMDPEGLAYDSKHQELYVEDSGANRILVFNVSAITDGEDAVGVIGQPDFASSEGSCTPTASTMCFPEGLSDYYDISNNRLYFSDFDDNRVLIFNFAKLSDSLPNGSSGSAYAVGSVGSQTQGATNYAVISGSLPPGLSLNNSSGSLSGIPSSAGVYNFTIKLIDNNGNAGTYTDTKPYSVTISQTGGSISSSTSASKSGSAQAKIDLDTTSTFITSTNSSDAYQVDSLSAGQTLSFTISSSRTDQHSITIDSISGDTVDFTLRSDPIKLSLSVGHSREIDVDNDGQNDIGIEPISISPPTASVKFWKVYTQSGLDYPKAALSNYKPTSISASSSAGQRWLWICAGALGIIIITGAWFYISKTKRLSPGPN